LFLSFFCFDTFVQAFAGYFAYYNLKISAMGNFGVLEIVLILLVVVLLFGGRKIPELMKGLGQGMKEFKKASRVDDDTQDKETKKDPKEE
jgi:sec-independent protein translocase protein TatA